MTFIPKAYFKGQVPITFLLCRSTSCYLLVQNFNVLPPPPLTFSNLTLSFSDDNITSTSAIEFKIEIDSNRNLSDIDFETIEVARQSNYGEISISITENQVFGKYKPRSELREDSFELHICDYWGFCTTSEITLKFFPDQQNTPLPCVGGIEFFLLGIIFGVESFDVSSPSKVWVFFLFSFFFFFFSFSFSFSFLSFFFFLFSFSFFLFLFFFLFFLFFFLKTKTFIINIVLIWLYAINGSF